MKTRFYKTLFVLSEFILMSLCCYADVPISVKDICGKAYPIVRIGNQLWMAENLACTKYDTESEAYKKGTKEIKTGYEIFGPYYVDVTKFSRSNMGYAENVTNAIQAKMGYVYNFAALMGYTESEAKTQTGIYGGVRQGICPNGWHIPSIAEGQELIKTAGGEANAGKNLKSKNGWSGNGSGDDSFGFTMYPSGTHVSSYASAMGRNGYITVTDAKSADEHHDLNFYYESNKVDDDGCSKKYAQSVRCLFDAKIFTIKVECDKNQGAVTGDGDYLEGEEVNIVAKPNENYIFIKWDDGNTNATRTITVTSDKTYTAYFELPKYNVSVISSDSEQGTVSGSGEYTNGTQVTIKATPKEYYEFTGWLDGNTEINRTIKVTSDTVFIARFIKKEAKRVKDICGITYPAVRIGNQLWMGESMACNKYDTESEAYKSGVKEVKIGIDTYAPFYTDITKFDRKILIYAEKVTDEIQSKMGYVYNFAAVMGYTESEAKTQTGNYDGVRQGICPNGWHVPSLAEGQELIKTAGGEAIAGKHLKSKSGWHNNGNGDDSFGLTVYPSGTNVYVSGGAMGRNNYFTVTDAKSTAYHHDLNFYYESDKVDDDGCPKNVAQSFRCVYNKKLYDVVILSATEVMGSVTESDFTGKREKEDGSTVRITAIPNDGYEFIGWSDGVTDATRTVTITSDTTFVARFIKEGQDRVKDACGFQYPIVRIGNQIWMAENMACNKYSDGRTIQAANSASEKYVPYYFDGRLNESEYATEDTEKLRGGMGYQYNWAAAMGLDNNAESFVPDENTLYQGVCPDGWHIPSQAEIDKLIAYCEDKETAATELKSNIGWNQGNGNDTYGFTLIPSGTGSGNGNDNNIGSESKIWTTYVSGSDIANANAMYVNADASVKSANDSKGKGYSVRCLKDTKIFDVTLQAEPADYGTVTGSGEYMEGDSATIEATPNDGYMFLEWDNGEKNNPAYVEVNSDMTITAKFVKENYTIRFQNEDGSLLQESDVAYKEIPSYDGETPTKASDKTYNYTFAGWNPKVTEVTENMTYTATYSSSYIEYPIKYAVAIGGTGEVSLTKGEETYASGSTFHYGEQVTLEAKPSQNYNFKNWNNHENYTTNPLTYTVTDSVVFVAFFTPGSELRTTYTLNISVNPDGSGTTEGAGEYTTFKLTDGGAYLPVIAHIKATPKIGYQFTNWTNGSGELISKDAETIIILDQSETNITANFVKNKVRIIFRDYNGSILPCSGLFDYDSTPMCDIPTKSPTQQYKYSFAGWNPEIVSATENATYYATYNAELQTYKVEYENGVTLQATDEEYGAMPHYYGDEPTKENTETTVYKFKGWSPTESVVTNDIVYTSLFRESARTYTIAFVQNTESGEEVLETDVYTYNAIPVYKGDRPVKESTAEYDYVFSGWNPTRTLVKSDVKYTAVFVQNKRSYRVLFYNYDESILQSDEFEYGDTPSYNGEIPKRENTAQYSYTFKGWDRPFETVVAETSYTAQYEENIRSYNITFKNWDGQELESGTWQYGSTPVYGGETPAKTATVQYTYTFTGWNKPISQVTGAETYTATFDSTLNEYTVKFINDDKTELQREQLEYGVMPRYKGAVPTKESPDKKYLFVFSGWSPAVTYVTKDATYEAVFTQVLNEFYVSGVSNNTYLGTVTGSGYYISGSTVTLTAQPKKGYALDYWSNGEKTASISIVVNKDTTVTAYFGRQNADNTPACNNVASVSKYNWLIMLDLNTLNAEGYTFTENQVRWYKVVGEMDNLSDPDYLRNDEFLKNEYYLTLDKSLTGTGTYYGLIDLVNQSDNVGCLNGIMRTEPHKYDATERNGDCTLLKTLVEPQETLEIINLPKGTKSYIKVFDATGNLIYEIESDGVETLQFNAADIPGTYMVTVFDESVKQTLRYIVK